MKQAGPSIEHTCVPWLRFATAGFVNFGPTEIADSNASKYQAIRGLAGGVERTSRYCA